MFDVDDTKFCNMVEIANWSSAMTISDELFAACCMIVWANVSDCFCKRLFKLKLKYSQIVPVVNTTKMTMASIICQESGKRMDVNESCLSVMCI